MTADPASRWRAGRPGQGSRRRPPAGPEQPAQQFARGGRIEVALRPMSDETYRALGYEPPEPRPLALRRLPHGRAGRLYCQSGS